MSKNEMEICDVKEEILISDIKDILKYDDIVSVPFIIKLLLFCEKIENNIDVKKHNITYLTSKYNINYDLYNDLLIKHFDLSFESYEYGSVENHYFEHKKDFEWYILKLKQFSRIYSENKKTLNFFTKPFFIFILNNHNDDKTQYNEYYQNIKNILPFVNPSTNVGFINKVIDINNYDKRVLSPLTGKTVPINDKLFNCEHLIKGYRPLITIPKIPKTKFNGFSLIYPNNDADVKKLILLDENESVSYSKELTKNYDDLADSLSLFNNHEPINLVTFFNNHGYNYNEQFKFIHNEKILIEYHEIINSGIFKTICDIYNEIIKINSNVLNWKHVIVTKYLIDSFKILKLGSNDYNYNSLKLSIKLLNKLVDKYGEIFNIIGVINIIINNIESINNSDEFIDVLYLSIVNKELFKKIK